MNGFGFAKGMFSKSTQWALRASSRRSQRQLIARHAIRSVREITAAGKARQFVTRGMVAGKQAGAFGKAFASGMLSQSRAESKALIGIGIAGLAVGGSMRGLRMAEGFRQGVVGAIHPNAFTSLSGGQRGVDAGAAGESGLSGLRFNFRRK